MTRRRLLLFAMLTVFLGLGVGAWLLWPEAPRTAITRENAAKIKVGMTLAEAEAILGGPARDESSGPLVYDYGIDKCPEIYWPREPMEWRSDIQIIRLVMDPSGHVTQSQRWGVRCAEESPIDMLRRWLRYMKELERLPRSFNGTARVPEPLL